MDLTDISTTIGLSLGWLGRNINDSGKAGEAYLCSNKFLALSLSVEILNPTQSDRPLVWQPSDCVYDLCVSGLDL